MDLDGPLDFENEDRRISSPVADNKKRKKVIGLDDLLSDFYVEKSKRINKENCRSRSGKNCDSDEDEHGKEALLSKYVDDCQNQMNEIGGEEEIHEWGLTIFGDQKPTPPSVSFDLESCFILNSFMNNNLNFLVELTAETGGTFLEGLLVNGWLTRLVLTRGHLEKSIAKWAFHLLLYSSKEEKRTSACDFWCAMLLSQDEISGNTVDIDWFPSYSDIKEALEAYGFLFSFSPNMEQAHGDNKDRYPRHIQSWIRFTSACCQIRSKQSIFIAAEAEQIIEVMICLLLDRRLLCLSILVHECMGSVIRYFKDDEWDSSCEKVAKSIASRVPKDLNCLRAVECISEVDNRSKRLRSAVSYQMLVVSFDYKAFDERILSSLISINVKDRSCDLFKTYIYLVLAENWLLSNSVLEENPVLSQMWAVFLRNCCCQINSTDLRSYASKVRTKASYLFQGCNNKNPS